jgi:hypothetical protein
LSIANLQASGYPQKLSFFLLMLVEMIGYPKPKQNLHAADHRGHHVTEIKMFIKVH